MATPLLPPGATRVTHSGELITPPVPPPVAFEDDTYCVWKGPATKKQINK